MRIPISTYRIQFNHNFDFKSAGKIISYLAELGISDLYASPVFKAKKGSLHGYDIVDSRQLNPELGSQSDFDQLISEVKNKGLFWLQDIVPNHMAFDSQNTILMDVLEKGKESPYYNFFDIDWDHPYESIKGRILAPFLGKFYAEALENGEIQLNYDESGLTIKYYDLKFPLKIESYIEVFEHNLGGLEQALGSNDYDFTSFLGALHFLKNFISSEQTSIQPEQIIQSKKTFWQLYSSNQRIKDFIEENIKSFNGIKGQPESFNALDKLISQQSFRLSFWKVAAEEINYRRFFTINELISLKVEDETVFNFTHELIFKLINEGKFSGIRVDHVDGLYDPAAYLKRLRSKMPDTYIIVEKILESKEELPHSWPVQGTTGYDFMNYVNGVFCKKDNDKEFSKLYYKFTEIHTSYEDLVCAKKRLIIGKHLAGNIDNLAHLLKRISAKDRYGRDITLYGLRRALVEVMTHFPVYRTYINQEIFTENDKSYIKETIAQSRKEIPGLIYEFNFIEKFLLLEFHDSLSERERQEWINFVMSFQQYTAPLMAKGFEDTILYTYNKLISLNEVGGNPNLFGYLPEEFHRFNKQRIESFPYTVNATSTHDVKRGEDIRARINVLSEIPREWQDCLKSWSKLNQIRKKKANNINMLDENDEYFIYQTILGAFPFEHEQIPNFIERMKEYVIKAVREAKVHTAWIKSDTDYENACLNFIGAILNNSEDNKFMQAFMPFQKKIAHYGVFNSLSQVFLKLTCPGVPDFYQGAELWDLSLVDPDNRRLVDFNKREIFLNEIKSRLNNPLDLINELLLDKQDGRIKLYLIYSLLQARKQRQDFFQNAAYIPLEVEGAYKNNIIAFARKYNNDCAIFAAARFFTSLVKEDALPLGIQVWADTNIIIPKELANSWKDVIIKQNIDNMEKLPAGKLFEYLPVCFLEGVKNYV
ncbi:MAG: malto-oligosyltrehalose synthase [Candidatus Omnitrophota bacterium]